MPVQVKTLAPEQITAGGRTVRATHYQLTGGPARDLWYDADKRLVHVRLKAEDGSTVDYVLR